MEKLVSIIVPVYNTETFLPKCIESIQNQTYSNIEIILVDDGSTDRSGDICDSYAENDTRIRVIHKENGGNTSARRAGLNASGGEYIAFMDSDDTVTDRMVQDLIEEIERSQADIVISNIVKVFTYGEMEVKNKFLPGIHEKKSDLIKNMVYYGQTDEPGVIPCLYAKMYKRELISRGFDDFPDNIQHAEDCAMVYWCILHAGKISFLDASYYRYNIHENGLCRSQDERFLEKVTQFYIYVKRLFEKQKEREHLLKQLDRFMLTLVIQGVNRKIGLSQKDLITKYHIDEKSLPSSRKVVLYGAGVVGRDVYKQLLKSDKIDISLWVDQNYGKCVQDGLPVKAVDCLQEESYDYILIAALRENMVANIKETLKKYSIPEEKIIWQKPMTIY